MVGREELLDAPLLPFGRHHRVAQEIFAAQGAEPALQRLLGLDPGDRRRQCGQQVDWHADPRPQRIERIVAVEPDDGREDHGVASLGEFAQPAGQRLEVAVVVEHTGDVGRTHLARVAADLLQVGQIDAPEAALDAVAAELLGDELRVEIEEALDIDDADLREGQAVGAFGGQVAVDGEPRGLRLAHRGDAEMVAAATPRNGDSGFAQQRLRPVGIQTARLGADECIGMLGLGPLQGGDAFDRVFDPRAVGQPAQQVERPRGEMERALSLRDDRATLAGLGQPDAAGHAGQASADDCRIEFHFAAVFCVSSDNPHTLS